MTTSTSKPVRTPSSLDALFAAILVGVIVQFAVGPLSALVGAAAGATLPRLMTAFHAR